MKDTTLGEPTISRQIELIAAVSFRVWGFIYALTTFSYVYRWELLNNYARMSAVPSRYENHLLQTYLFDVLFHALMSVIMFLLSTPLAKLVCRGLAQTLQLKPLE